jgi:hypothetical protein
LDEISAARALIDMRISDYTLDNSVKVSGGKILVRYSPKGKRLPGLSQLKTELVKPSTVVFKDPDSNVILDQSDIRKCYVGSEEEKKYTIMLIFFDSIFGF